MKEKALEKYRELKAEKPNLDAEMVQTFIEDMPEEAITLFDRMVYGCHIVDAEMYEKAVHLLKWSNGIDAGPKWSVNEIVKLSGINFDEKPYYEHDYAYAVNMFWSDFSNIFTEPTYYLKMAKNYLENNDYWCDSSERAYKNAKKRIKHYEDK